MIDEVREYQELLTDRIACGDYYKGSKNPSFLMKLKSGDSRAIPPSSALLVLRHFLFEGINDWSTISLEERKERIYKAKIAFLCWLGDKDSYKEGESLLKDEFTSLVKDNKSAYEMFLDANVNAVKLKASRENIIKTLKDNNDFYQKFYKGCLDYKNYRFDTLIPNAIALGPIRHTIVAFKKGEIKELLKAVISYHYVGDYSLDVRRGNWVKTLLLSSYLAAYQYNYYGINYQSNYIENIIDDSYVDVANIDIVTLLNDDKCLKLNGKDVRYNAPLLTKQPNDLSSDDSSMIDYAFDVKVREDDGLNNLWKPNQEITKYIYLFNDEKDVSDEFIYFTNMTGPNFMDAFIDKLGPLLPIDNSGK